MPGSVVHFDIVLGPDRVLHARMSLLGTMQLISIVDRKHVQGGALRYVLC